MSSRATTPVDARGVIVAESLTDSGTEDFEEILELLDRILSQWGTRSPGIVIDMYA